MKLIVRSVKRAVFSDSLLCTIVINDKKEDAVYRPHTTFARQSPVTCKSPGRTCTGLADLEESFNEARWLQYNYGFLLVQAIRRSKGLTVLSQRHIRHQHKKLLVPREELGWGSPRFCLQVGSSWQSFTAFDRIVSLYQSLCSRHFGGKNQNKTK